MNFIWDLDGTIIDSYPIMTMSIVEVTKDDYRSVYQYIKKYAINDYFLKYAKENNLSIEILRKAYQDTLAAYERKGYQLLEGFLDAFNHLRSHDHYIYTHRGSSTHTILKGNSIDHCFIEIVTSHNKFKRKPDPEGLIYLIDKYNLNRDETFYIGDRKLDVICGQNAHIQTVFLGDKIGDYNIKSLKDMIDIF